jgi:hypothetical protein
MWIDPMDAKTAQAIARDYGDAYHSPNLQAFGRGKIAPKSELRGEISRLMAFLNTYRKLQDDKPELARQIGRDLLTVKKLLAYINNL